MNVRSVHSMLVWARHIADRRNKAITAVVLARKLAGILFRIWRDGTTYGPKRATLEKLTA